MRTVLFHPNPQGGTPPPLHFAVGQIGVGAPRDGCRRTVEGRWPMKVDRPPFSGTCFRHWFSACSWHVLGEFSAPLAQKSHQNWSPKQTKTRPNRNEGKSALMSALNTIFGGVHPSFCGPFWLHFGTQNSAERLSESKQKFDPLLKVTFEAPGTILVPFWSPKWNPNGTKVVTKRTSCRKSAFSLKCRKTNDFSMKIGGRGLHFGGPCGPKFIKKRR